MLNFIIVCTVTVYVLIFKNSNTVMSYATSSLCACVICIHPTPLFYLFKFFHMEFHQKNNPARSCQNFTLSIHANMDLLQLLQMHMTTSSCDLKLARSWLCGSQDHLSCKTSWLQPIFWDCLEKGLSLSTLEFSTLSWAWKIWSRITIYEH